MIRGKVLPPNLARLEEIFRAACAVFEVTLEEFKVNRTSSFADQLPAERPGHAVLFGRALRPERPARILKASTEYTPPCAQRLTAGSPRPFVGGHLDSGKLIEHYWERHIAWQSKWTA
jgi:hypothetical protein